MTYLFVLGNTPELGKLEVEFVLQRLGVNFTSEFFQAPYLAISTGRELSSEQFALLGGTVKVGEVISQSITDYLKSLGKKTLDFGISGQTDPQKIKRELREAGVKSRFVLPKRGERDLSSVVVKKQNLVEFLETDGLTARTIWVQDFEDWNRRDYGRPEVEAHIGMLPPKVARMMVNAALSETRNQKPETILDPFCGVGTILAEALMVGANVIGTDINSSQVEKARRNLEWLAREYQVSAVTYRVLPGDARRVTQILGDKKVDGIVTEPDLGPNNPRTAHQATNITYKKLQELYLEALADWRKSLRPHGRVVIVLPKFVDKNGEVWQELVKNVIDKAKLMGYSLIARPVDYGRPQAAVRRNICIFQYGTH